MFTKVFFKFIYISILYVYLVSTYKNEMYSIVWVTANYNWTKYTAKNEHKQK